MEAFLVCLFFLVVMVIIFFGFVVCLLFCLSPLLLLIVDWGPIFRFFHLDHLIHRMKLVWKYRDRKIIKKAKKIFRVIKKEARDNPLCQPSLEMIRALVQEYIPDLLYQRHMCFDVYRRQLCIAREQGVSLEEPHERKKWISPWMRDFDDERDRSSRSDVLRSSNEHVNVIRKNLERAWESLGKIDTRIREVLCLVGSAHSSMLDAKINMDQMKELEERLQRYLDQFDEEREAMAKAEQEIAGVYSDPPVRSSSASDSASHKAIPARQRITH